MLHSVLHCVRQVKKLPVNHFVRAPQTSQQLDALSAGCSRGGSFKGGAILSLPGTKMAPLPSLPPHFSPTPLWSPPCTKMAAGRAMVAVPDGEVRSGAGPLRRGWTKGAGAA